MKFHIRTLLVLLFLSFTLNACDSAEPDHDHAGEEELITRVVVTLTSGTETVTANANDPDGDGTGFEIDPIVLSSGTTYSGSITLWDDVNLENITEEIEEEDDEHQFFYTVGGGVSDRVDVSITDRDSNNLPVGLTFDLVVSDGGPASGTLNVVLSHFDDQPKNGSDRSDETDVNVTFTISLQ
ncbi:MAG: hypothetical protein P8H65_11040 [Rhodothermales bacterium]|mgnify:CR=1 FL=1|jgi:hypothetical protein|nr:hypothetical protein [Rhodothermales bacterium]MDG2016482.1 hypothetical protein [Rhodothermales bacterium]HAY36043.1 type 1 periplasmic binding fold superfamily protein [Bacteroidota bacterium]